MERYRNYWIEHQPKPVPTRAWDWSFHYDGYDGPGDPRHGDAGSLEQAKREIDLLIDIEHPELHAEDEKTFPPVVVRERTMTGPSVFSVWRYALRLEDGKRYGPLSETRFGTFTDAHRVGYAAFEAEVWKREVWR